MRRILLAVSIAGALTALIVGGHACTARPQGAAGSPADTIALADSVQRSCGALGGTEKTSCVEQFLVPLVSSHGVPAAMGTLGQLARRDPAVLDDGHVFAHAIGITAGKGGGDVAQTFASCTDTFESGCYHGVIQGYFEGVRAVDTSTVNALCRSYAAPGANRWLRFQCVHGMGHGLTMFYAHDLPRALASCDLLAETWDRDACYGGAFMENIVNATRPHHPATRLAADARAGGPSDHSHGSTHEHGTAAASFKALDSTDLQYPCSIVAARYLFQCYQMQTSVMLHFTNGDVGAAAKHCLGAPPRMRPMCFRSLGRDIFALAHQRTEEASRMCSLAAARYQPWCHAGLAKQFIGLTTTVEDGVAYCRVVPGEGNRLKCYEAVGEQVATLKNDPRDRAAMCEGIRQAAHRTACLYGARVQFTRPAGLPTETEN